MRYVLLARRQGVKLDDVSWPVGTMHDLRKSYGTHMARRVTMPELQKLMGHASITTTAEFYIDVSADMSEQVRAVFASA